MTTTTAADEQHRTDLALLAVQHELEDELLRQGVEADAQMVAAVEAADLNGAFAAWLRQQTIRTARQTLRDRVRVAEQRARTGQRLVGPEYLRDYPADFAETVTRIGVDAGRRRGYEDGNGLCDRASTP